MGSLIKIKDLSSRYDITSRTLRYYEDMGLITGSRNDENNYRMYDEDAVRRLEQILILRKLNIGIKDIQRIFNASGSGVVLEVLNKKVKNIDDEVALLYELKEIVLDFMHAIKQMNFADNSDIKLLYEKAKVIEMDLTNVNFSSKTPNINRLIEITDKLDKKTPDVMVVRVPKFKAITTGYHSWQELMNNGGASDQVWNHKKLFKNVVFECADFLKRRNDKFEWICAVNDDTTEADVAPTQLIMFEGGLYAMSVSIDGDMESIDKVENKIRLWLDSTNFEYDDSRDIMGHMAYNGKDIKKGLGYNQLQRFVPIKLKAGGQ